MKNKQMFITHSLALLVVLALAGCGDSAGKAAGPETAAQNVSSAPESTMPPESSDGAAKDAVTAGELPQPAGYPGKNISWIVAAPAGAAIDLPTRALVDCIDLKSPAVIENIAGASNVTGTLEASIRAGDGYTILTTNSSGMVSQPSMYDTGYSPDDFRHLALLEPVSPFAVVVNPNSAIGDAQAWVDYVKSGQEFNYSVPNAGSSAHLAIIKCLEELNSTSGTYVPYNGSAEVSSAILSGEIDFAVLGVSDNIIPQAEAGNLRILVVLNDEVCNMVPDIPIISDYGVKNCNVFYGFKYIAIKKDTPDEIVEWLKQEIYAGLSSEKYQNYIQQSGLVSLDVVSEEEVTKIVMEAYEVYSVMLKELGMTE